MPAPSSERQSSIRMRVAAPLRRIHGIGISIRPLLPQRLSRWCGATCVDTVEVEAPPAPEVDQAAGEAIRYETWGRRSTSAIARAGSPAKEVAARAHHRVAADVVEAPPPMSALLRTFAGVEMLCRRTSALATARDAGPRAGSRGRDPLRVKAHHDASAIRTLFAALRSRRRLAGGERDRLLAQHVLAAGRRLQRQRPRADDWAAGCRPPRSRDRRAAPS